MNPGGHDMGRFRLLGGAAAAALLFAPGAVWAQAQRTADEAKLAQLALSLPAAEQAMCVALDALQK